VHVARLAIEPLREALRNFPAVALLGPRQAGKTTLATRLAEEEGGRALYLDLERVSDLAKLVDPELYLARHEAQLVILDHVPRTPAIFQVMSNLIDRRRRFGITVGQFLVLGSPPRERFQRSAEALVDHMTYLELTPFLAAEVSENDDAADRLWVRGGFPDSFLAKREPASFDWRRALIQTYLERGIQMPGPRLSPQTLHGCWQMLARDQGQMFSASRLAPSLGVGTSTVLRCVKLLVDLLLVRRLQPWTGNLKRQPHFPRLAQRHKIYLRDSGLLHTLLGIRNKEQLLRNPVVGRSWEGLVIENLLSQMPPLVTARFYRSWSGAQIDLLLEFPAGYRHAVEIRRSIHDPRPSKGFRFACDDLNVAGRWVVYPGEKRYRLDAHTEVIPFAEVAQPAFRWPDPAEGGE